MNARSCGGTALCARAFTFCDVRNWLVANRRMAVRLQGHCRQVALFQVGIYGAVTLSAGNVFFDEIGVLQPHEFDGEAILDVADHTALRLADRDHNADRWSQFGRDADRRA